MTTIASASESGTRSRTGAGNHSGVPVVWVDAFSDRPWRGNPAAVCLLEHPVAEEPMQSLAFELGVSETAYVWPAGDGEGYSLRWFTPTAEVALCGHATVAAAHALAQLGRVAGTEPVVFHTKSGQLGARFVDGRVAIDLPAERPISVEVPEGIDVGRPVRAAVEGTFDLALELDSADDVCAAAPDLDAVAALSYRGVIVTARARDDEATPKGARSAPGDGEPDYVLRFFAPKVGVPEDPVTGSAQCLLGPFWAERLGRTSLEAAQLSARTGRLGVTVGHDRVEIAGHAVTVLVAELDGSAASALKERP